jgi:putative transposase
VEKANYPITVMCDVLDVSPSGYHAWKRRGTAPRVVEEALIVDEIKAAHCKARGVYGSPRIHRELRANGRRVSRKRVERLMKREGIAARKKRRFARTTDSNHANPIAPNLLARKFEASMPNAAWVTDVTYVWTLEGWLYLAAILDLYSRRVVGWAASPYNDRTLALQALARARRTRSPPSGLLHHSDRGSVYTSGDYVDAVTRMGGVVSMSRRGDCWDNAVAESFFATIKGELIEHVAFATRADAIVAIADYIDDFYNPVRRHSSIGYVSPIEFELKFRQEGLAA